MKFDWLIAFRKGLEAAVPATLAATGMQAFNGTTGEEQITTVVIAIVAFLFNYVKNWWKHRT